jgi:hypothetical protein
MQIEISSFIDLVNKNENGERIEKNSDSKYGNENGNGNGNGSGGGNNERRIDMRESNDREEGKEGRKRERQDHENFQKDGKFIRRGTEKLFSLFPSLFFIFCL